MDETLTDEEQMDERIDGEVAVGFVDLSLTGLRQLRQQLPSSSVLAGCVERALADLENPHPPAAGFNAIP